MKELLKLWLGLFGLIACAMLASLMLAAPALLLIWMIWFFTGKL